MAKAERIKLPRQLAKLDGVRDEFWQWTMLLVPIGLLFGYMFLTRKASATNGLGACCTNCAQGKPCLGGVRVGKIVRRCFER